MFFVYSGYAILLFEGLRSIRACQIINTKSQIGRPWPKYGLMVAPWSFNLAQSGKDNWPTLECVPLCRESEVKAGKGPGYASPSHYIQTLVCPGIMKPQRGPRVLRAVVRGDS